MKITLKRSGGPYGDATSSYSVKMDSNYTVEEFAKYILSEKADDWGYINNKNSLHRIIEYRRGRLVGDHENYNSFKNKRIVSMGASGGWSRMDYDIIAEE